MPTLDGTCKKLLRSLTPLCPTQKEYNNVAKKIADNGIKLVTEIRAAIEKLSKSAFDTLDASSHSELFQHMKSIFMEIGELA